MTIDTIIQTFRNMGQSEIPEHVMKELREQGTCNTLLYEYISTGDQIVRANAITGKTKYYSSKGRSDWK